MNEERLLDATELRKLMLTKVVSKIKELNELIEGMMEQPAVELSYDELNEMLDLSIDHEWNNKPKKIIFKAGKAAGWVELRCPIRTVMRKV
jgi:division protein CdvB (Snf7/Vps24/ESCRT-III family)